MKKQITFIITLVLFTSLFSQSVKKVLFIGNSYTGVNNLPNLVFKVAQSTNDSLIYDAHTPGGRRLLHHSASAVAIGKIFADDWDFVTIQGQSQEPSFALAQLQAEVFPHAKILCDTIRANNTCTQPLFYTTWGRENGDAGNCAVIPWVCTYEGMDSALTNSYTTMAMDNNAEMSPVGPVWKYIRTNYPAIDLYTADGSHPSMAGSYAAACTFYSMIFKKDPTLITWNSSLSAAIADSIKVAAKRVAFDSLPNWDFSQITPNSNFTYTINNNTVNFTSESTLADSLIWDFGDSTTSTITNPTKTYSDSGIYTVLLTTYTCGRMSTTSIDININTTIDSTHTGINKTFSEDIASISPNPASNFIQLHLKKSFEKTSISIVDQMGKMVLNDNIYELSNHTIDISTLPEGVYYLNIRTNKNFWTTKMIKKD